MSAFLAIDQYGNRTWIEKHPAKELRVKWGGSPKPMFQDRKDGTYQVGYVIRDMWFTVLGLEGRVFARKIQ